MATMISSCAKHVLVATFFALISSLSFAAEPIDSDDSTGEPWTLLPTGVDASLRGLSVVSSRIVWTSGTGGTVLRTNDGGRTWANVSLDDGEDAADLDFRDIHAFDAKNAVITSAGQPARIYGTSDAGKTWHMQFEHPHSKAFFDALSFWDEKHGIVMSDPVDGRVLLIQSEDGGETWHELPHDRKPQSRVGEYGFAASGTNMCVVGDQSVYIALGGANEGQANEGQAEDMSRVLYSHDQGKQWAFAMAPIARSPSSGIFSIAFADAKSGIVVGGDYKNEGNANSNIAVTTDGGKTWTKPIGKPPRGFRSCVTVRKAAINAFWIAVGPTGTDYSIDGGNNWCPASETGFHAVQFSPDGAACFASGTDGRVAIWTEQPDSK